MKLLLLATAMLIVAACSGGSDEPEAAATASPTPAGEQEQTPEPTATATSTPLAASPTDVPATRAPDIDPEIFRTFVRDQVSPALQTGDINFFAQRARTNRIECTSDNTPTFPGGPTCEEVGTSFDGFAVGFWGSEAFVVPVEDALGLIEMLWTAAADSVTDSYGDSTPRIFALGIATYPRQVTDGHLELVTDEQIFSTVLTGLINEPSETGGTGPLRRVAVQLSWRNDGDDFELIDLTSALRSGSDFLTQGVLDYVMSEWEPFQP